MKKRAMLVCVGLICASLAACSEGKKTDSGIPPAMEETVAIAETSEANETETTGTTKETGPVKNVTKAETKPTETTKAADESKTETKAVDSSKAVEKEETKAAKKETVKTETKKPAEKATEAPKKETAKVETTTPKKEAAPAPAPAPKPVHEHSWKEVTKTEDVWVPQMVEEPVYETQQVYDHSDIRFNATGVTFNAADESTWKSYAMQLMDQGISNNCSVVEVYRDETVQVGTQTVDKGHYETKTTVTGYTCTTCGATK